MPPARIISYKDKKLYRPVNLTQVQHSTGVLRLYECTISHLLLLNSQMNYGCNNCCTNVKTPFLVLRVMSQSLTVMTVTGPIDKGFLHPLKYFLLVFVVT